MKRDQLSLRNPINVCRESRTYMSFGSLNFNHGTTTNTPTEDGP